MTYERLDTDHKRRAHRIFKDILDRHSRSAHPKILDVGCAFGVIAALKGDGRNIFGIERDPGLRALAEKKCQKVYAIDLNDFNADVLGESGFDFIFCGDIVEHVLDPNKLLGQLVRLLAKDGYLVISVPNIAQFYYRFMLLFGRFDYTETGVLDRTHLHLYTEKTARSLIENAGLEVIQAYPSGTLVSYITIFPRLFASQFVFFCAKART